MLIAWIAILVIPITSLVSLGKVQNFLETLKQQLELDMEQWTGSKLGKEDIKTVYCHPDYLTYMQSTSRKMLGWMKHKLESRLPWEISITSDRQMTPHLRQKAKKNIRASWWKWKRRVKKVGLQLNIQETKIMASGEFEQTLVVGGGQAGLACCSPWGHKEPYTTERQNWSN